MQKIILIMCIIFAGCSALNIRKDIIIINNEKKTTNVDEITKQNLSEKYGISADYLPVVVGDLIIDSRQALNEMKCEKGSTEIIGYTGKKKIRYIVDCRFDKIVN